MNLKFLNERISKLEESFLPKGIIENFESAINRTVLKMNNNEDNKIISETLRKYSSNKRILNCYSEAVNNEMLKMI